MARNSRVKSGGMFEANKSVQGMAGGAVMGNSVPFFLPRGHEAQHLATDLMRDLVGGPFRWHEAKTRVARGQLLENALLVFERFEGEFGLALVNYGGRSRQDEGAVVAGQEAAQAAHQKGRTAQAIAAFVHQHVVKMPVKDE